ncbi:hypothetical protein HPB48_019317 [Haemaphysalis longicornis]|uniref:Mutator-like transposase domain-containing protein n=1 Tax=Haemaphysalis longicornis TaxID=44386 RepID=A0A9J6FNL1_HAELO|nr:hypothetical protein HPB48_019317 [Haemaphysalis longicornis]
MLAAPRHTPTLLDDVMHRFLRCRSSLNSIADRAKMSGAASKLQATTVVLHQLKQNLCSVALGLQGAETGWGMDLHPFMRCGVGHMPVDGLGSDYGKALYSDMDPTFTKNITVVYDGTWMTRGHSAHTGLGAVIEFYSGLVLDFVVLSNYCHGCTLGRSQSSARHSACSLQDMDCVEQLKKDALRKKRVQKSHEGKEMKFKKHRSTRHQQLQGRWFSRV